MPALPLLDSRREFLTRGAGPADLELAEGVGIRVFVSGEKGSRGLSTGVARFTPGALLPYHTHTFSEVITVLSGHPVLLVEDRSYRVSPYDALHIPAGVPHAVLNDSAEPAELHWSMASPEPTRELVSRSFTPKELPNSLESDPEHLSRFSQVEPYALSPGTEFRDLFASRMGSRGICGGYGLFPPGASLPCHYHDYDESITIVQGKAICQVAGAEYEVSDNDTACVPTGRPHRFINRSNAPMAMIWVYAGDEPDRVLVDQGLCDGTIPLSTLQAQQSQQQ